MTERPDSIHQLTERVNRGVKSIHDDLCVLTDYDIVHLKQSERAKRLFVPYDSAEACLELSTRSSADDTEPV